MVRCLLALAQDLRASDITAEFCRVEGISYSAALACREQLEASEEQQRSRQADGQPTPKLRCRELADDSESFFSSSEPFYLRLHLASISGGLEQPDLCPSSEIVKQRAETSAHLDFTAVKFENADVATSATDCSTSAPLEGRIKTEPSSDLLREANPLGDDVDLLHEGDFGPPTPPARGEDSPTPPEGFLSDLEDDFLDSILEVSNKRADSEASSSVDQNTDGEAPKSGGVAKVKQREYCDFCNFSTLDSEHLSHHVRLKHEGMKRPCLYCQLCNFSTTYRTLFNKHLSTDHMNEEGWYLCPKCSYVTECKANLYRHFNRHSKKYVYKCPVCSFVCSGNLGRHVRSQHGVSLLKCDKCRFSTWSRVKYEDHLNSHEGRNKMTCGLCNWGTFFRQSFAKHMHHYHNNPNSGGIKVDFFNPL